VSKENVALVKGIYAGFAAGDVAAVLGRMSPSIVWNEAENFPYADGNPYVGPDAVANGVFARCISQWDGFAVAVDELLDAGDAVVVLGRYLGTYKATGKSMRAQLAHIWRIADGKAVAFQQYADTLQVAHVTGASSRVG
jgi:ketosteroid isomerase-like protein